MFAARKAAFGAAIAAALCLAGCQSEQAPTARSIQALPPELMSLMQEKGMTKQDPILLRIYKEESKAEIWKKRRSDGRYALLKSYDICRFSGKLGPKIKEGDKQAPEGFYSVGPAQMNPRSNYYLSFNIGYPNAYDRALGRTGLHVMMHGDCLSAGCYAMTDKQIGEIYGLAREAFAAGQKEFQVQALPFRMTAQNMARRRNDPNMPFWRNLKQGSDNFEVTRLEPKVDVCGKKYVFNATASGASPFEPTAQCPSYQVDPAIARAVAAKEKADNILIARLSKEEPPAPEYVAQNGRLRRTLDQPIVMVAQAPATAAAMTAAANAPAEVKPLDAGPVAVAANASGDKVPLPPMREVALKTDAPAPDAAKPEGGFFARMFRSDGEQQPSQPAATAQPGSTLVAAKSPGSEPAGGARTVAAEQAPVMASSVSPAPVAGRSSGAGGWLHSLGGLFGGSSAEQPAPAAEPAATAVSAPAAPAARTRNRQAYAAPSQQQSNARVAAAFADAR